MGQIKFWFPRNRRKCRSEKVQRKASSRDSGWPHLNYIYIYIYIYYIYIYTTSFLIAARESIDNSNIMSKMQMQQKHFGRDYDERMFKEAATRKIRTFKYDPTKPVEIKFKDGKSAK